MINPFSLNEYEIVRLKRIVPEIPLPQGAKGTVVLVYQSYPPAYEVEFVDDTGETLGVYTVRGVDMEVVQRR